jgi:hypothetical protein
MGYLKLYVHGQLSCTSNTAVIYSSGAEVKRKTLTKTTSTTDYPLWQTSLGDGNYTVTATCNIISTCTKSANFTIAGNTVTVDLTMPCLGGLAPAKATARKAAAGKAKAKTACCCSCNCGTQKAVKPAAKKVAKKVVKLVVKQAPAKAAAKPAAKKAKKA